MNKLPGLKALGTTLVLAATAIAGLLLSSPRGRADDRDDRDERDNSKIEQGFDIAPVHLTFERKDRALVGLGSYIVNTEGCNDCHSAGPPTQFVRGQNPFFGQPKMINPKTYLGGGRDFGELVPPPGIGSAHIISRNLTPTPKTGLPEGDHTFAEFLEIFRTGKDFDHLHPTCTGAPNPGCVPQPFDGDLLQIMPWPNFKDLTDHDIRAIYEYLKAVPCIQGNYPGEPADRCAT
jgi:hypothetical protein